MSSSEKKNWAVEYILDPLNEPTPSQETGLGSSSLSANASGSTPSSKQAAPASTSRHGSDSPKSANPFRRSSPKSSPKSPSSSGKSPTITRTREFSNSSARSFPPVSPEPARRSAEHRRPSPPSAATVNTRPRRTSSLRERYPGDKSHHPLATLTRDNKLANRSPHLKKKHLPGADLVDKLDDTVLSNYHHEGPYDAASLARNNSYQSSPVAALNESNAETLKATPRERIEDSLRGHKPLDGVAIVPPGQKDGFGRVYHYQEGGNLMIEDGGNYKRWPGLDYHPDDIKGKGEPSYSIEKQLKEHKAHAQKHRHGSLRESTGDADIELAERPRGSHDTSAAEYENIGAASGAQHLYHEGHETRRRNGSGAGARISGEFKKRFGSLRKRDGHAARSANPGPD